LGHKPTYEPRLYWFGATLPTGSQLRTSTTPNEKGSMFLYGKW